MPNVEKISIALPPEMVAQLRDAVATGEYASSSEVVRDALRGWTHKRKLQQNGVAELRQLWQEARADKSVGLILTSSSMISNASTRHSPMQRVKRNNALHARSNRQVRP